MCKNKAGEEELEPEATVQVPSPTPSLNHTTAIAPLSAPQGCYQSIRVGGRHIAEEKLGPTRVTRRNVSKEIKNKCHSHKRQHDHCSYCRVGQGIRMWAPRQNSCMR